MKSLVLVVLLALLSLTRVNAQESDLELERLGKITESLVSYQRCRLDSDCRENSFCYDNDNARVGYCKCQAGYELLFRNKTMYLCLKLAQWGEPCEMAAQCMESLGSLSSCNGVCGCSENSYRSSRDGRCHQRILLDDYCQTDANCLLEDGTRAFCTDGTCQCNIGLRPSADRKHCIEARSLGQNCTDNYMCSLVENSVCGGVCRCAVGFVVSRNGTSCLKAATYFYDSCEENDQCSEFLSDSLCINGSCLCQVGFHGYETKCVRSVDIGRSCTDTAECIPSPQFQTIADCIEGTCQCRPGVRDERMNCTNFGFKLIVNIVLVGLGVVISTFFL